MLNVALTGNVAAGKSSVASWFAEWGATVIDSDALVHEAQLPGSPALAAIREQFGDDVIRADGSLDRAVLRARVLRDPRARAALNDIVHPAVQQRRDELAEQARARGDRVLLNDIPLLFEVLDPAAFDVVVLIDAPVEVRRERLIQERGLPRDIADRLIAAQMPSTEKRAHSDIVIDNDGTLDALREKAADAWRRLLDLASDAR